MSDFEFKIVKEDRDYKSNNPLDFVINSNYQNIFTKLSDTGSYTFATHSYGVGTVRIATVHHGLGYEPSYLAYLTDNNSNYTYLPSWYAFYSAGDFSWNTDTKINAYVDKEYFYIDFVKTATGSPPSDSTAWKDMQGVTFNFKYYIFVNDIN